MSSHPTNRSGEERVGALSAKRPSRSITQSQLRLIFDLAEAASIPIDPFCLEQTGKSLRSLNVVEASRLIDLLAQRGEVSTPSR